MHIGRFAALTWSEGQVTSEDAIAERVARGYAASMESVGVEVTPSGPFCRGNLLSDALCAYYTLLDLFESAESEGDVPVPPTVPSGATP